MSARKKAVAVKVPATIAEADELIAAYGEHERALAAIATHLEEDSAKLKATAELSAGTHKRAMDELFARIQGYADAHRGELTGDGKTKRAERPAGIIGWRIDPPSVKLQPKATIKGVIAWLLQSRRTLRFRKFLRVKYELDKEAMLKDEATAETVPGISIMRDVEQFYIEPTQLTLAGQS